MRLAITLLIILVFVLVGVVFGALNAAVVPFDLGFARVSVPKGAAVLAALVVGWILGGIVAWSGTRARQRRRKRDASARASATASANDS
ncbi:MAG TPA: lipopolysaccharide assembly protein LapA domain-containing protein [Oleiagrimonas sp.]|nr:lipopolysaccharide assembly protein LapA domain-containing protein [Oleiagrimonas sp.]